MVQSWKASDESLHATEQEAKEKDFQIAFDEWLGGHFPDDQNEGNRTFVNLVATIRNDRMNLLKVLKLLNGGNGIPPVPPIKQPTE
jgi:hypothetical protein